MTKQFLIRKIAAICTAFIFWAVGFVLYQSVWPHTEPVTVRVSNVEVLRDVNSLRIKWKCDTVINRPVSGTLTRTLMRKDGGEMIALATSDVDYKPSDPRTPQKSLMLPSSIDAGEWCVKSKLKWYEPLSLRESQMTGMEVCFTVPEPPIPDTKTLSQRVAELESHLLNHQYTDFSDHLIMRKEAYVRRPTQGTN